MNALISVPLWAGIYRTLCSDPTTEDRFRRILLVATRSSEGP